MACKYVYSKRKHIPGEIKILEAVLYTSNLDFLKNFTVELSMHLVKSLNIVALWDKSCVTSCFIILIWFRTHPIKWNSSNQFQLLLSFTVLPVKEIESTSTSCTFKRKIKVCVRTLYFAVHRERKNAWSSTVLSSCNSWSIYIPDLYIEQDKS